MQTLRSSEEMKLQYSLSYKAASHENYRINHDSHASHDSRVSRALARATRKLDCLHVKKIAKCIFTNLERTQRLLKRPTIITQLSYEKFADTICVREGKIPRLRGIVKTRRTC
jgi:hypothetical protein